MNRIQPKRPGYWKQWLRRIQSPLTFVTVRPLTVGAAAIVIGCLIWGTSAVWGPLIDDPLPSKLLQASCRTVTFRLDWPLAEKVTVIGSFNQWQAQGYQMHRNRSDGAWQLGIELKPGVYAYAFVIDDDQVVADPHALWGQEDGFGNRNSMVSIDNGCYNENRM